MTTNGKDRVIEKWRRLFSLRGWTIRLRNEQPPEPARHAAFTEYEFADKQAVTWIVSESDAIHELLHLVLAPLSDAFWRTQHDKALRALWNRREEDAVKRLEKAIRRVGRGA